jgi:hypothetical protein
MRTRTKKDKKANIEYLHIDELLIYKDSEYHGTRKFKEDYFFLLCHWCWLYLTPLHANAGRSQPARKD